MTTSLHRSGPRPPTRLGAVALLTACAFGCTTIRQPVSLLPPAVTVRDGSAEPQLALWLESADRVKPEEATRATARARAALKAALADRDLGDDGMLLVVREQGVTRTQSHRDDQSAAVMGLVLGAVVVVVGLVVLASQGKSSGSGSAAASRAPGHPAWRPGGPSGSPSAPVRFGPRPAPPSGGGHALRPAPPSGFARPRPPPPAPAPRPPRYLALEEGPSMAFEVDVDLLFPPAPLEWRPGGPVLVSSRELPGPEALEVPLVEAGPGAADGAAFGPGEGNVPPLDPPPLSEVVLPPVPQLDLAERGFFAGDALTLELTLVDKITGEPRWTKWVEAEADPCDKEAVREVLDRAFQEAAGWSKAP